MSQEQEVQVLWQRLETQLQWLMPEIKECFRPGASENTLQRVEAFIPIILPEEVKAWYRIHDGGLPLIDGWVFYSLKRMCYFWLIEMSEYSYPISLDDSLCISPGQEFYTSFWHPHWLPFMGHWFGPQYWIDLAPGPKGNVGQILFRNDRYDAYPDFVDPASSIRVVASGLQEFFATLTRDLEAGVYTFDEATGILWSREMWLVLSRREVCQLDDITGMIQKIIYGVFKARATEITGDEDMPGRS